VNEEYVEGDVNTIDDGYSDDDVNENAAATATAVLAYIATSLAEDPDDVEVDVKVQGKKLSLAQRRTERHGPRDRPPRSHRAGYPHPRGRRRRPRRGDDVGRHRRLTMSDDERLLDVGYIARAHGLKGQVAVALTTDRLERVAPGSQFITDRGTLTVVASAAHQDRFIVTFSEIRDRTAAEAWRGTALRATRLDVDDEDVIWIDELFEAEVFSKDGTSRGRVVAVEENPASDMLVLDSGALVPLTFVVELEANVRIDLDEPDGLFE
jgi:16S rRNA processing protein RimM